LQAYIVLGCNGHVDLDGFLYCDSISNPIIDLTNVKAEDRDRLYEFLENACELFDKVCHDYNKCINIITYLYKNFNLISEDKLHKIQAFIRMHKICGVYIMLVLKEDYNV
tara:strand:+ start:3768 stop:4097 length:330 start_codon:yes stop_codon:yes gene_type:complete